MVMKNHYSKNNKLSKPVLNIELFSLLLTSGLVLSGVFLPKPWQYQIIVILASFFSGLLLYLGARNKATYTLWQTRIICLLFYVISLLLVLSTGAFESLYYFVLIISIWCNFFFFTLGYNLYLLGLALAVLLAQLPEWELAPYFATYIHIPFRATGLIVSSLTGLILSRGYLKQLDTEDRLLLTEQLLETFAEEDEAILDNVTAGVIIIDRRQLVREFSSQAELITGLEAQTVLQQKITEYLLIADGQQKQVEITVGLLLACLYEGKTTERLLCYLTNKNNEHTKQVYLTIKPIISNYHKPQGAILIFEDAELVDAFRLKYTAQDDQHPV